MKVYTIESGKVSEGAIVEMLALKGAGIEIPAVIVGEEGRGRERGVLPVQLTNCQYKEWQEKGRVRIMFAEVGTTKAGKPKLLAKDKDSAGNDEKIVCVFRTHIGFRGGNNHTGDRTGEEEYDDWGTKKTRPTFAPFPGEILVRGIIAQGAAGRMGSGEQLVAVMPPKCVFRTTYSGRLYGAPSAHYYCWNGQQLLGGLTWDERCASDIF